MRYTFLLATAASLLAATPAFAQEVPAGPFTISGSAALVSDYRFRGVSQSDEGIAAQAGFSVAHESGFYVGTWGSNLAGWGTFGGSNTELDLYGGYKYSMANGIAIDAGLLWYMYPSGADNTDFAEPYIKVSGTFGPATILSGVAYAPKQEALGNFSNLANSRGQKKDNLYVWTDASAGVPNTPVTIKGHIGYSKGNPGLGPNGTSVAPTGQYLDWLVGADVAVGPLVLGVAYVDTSITKSDAAYLQPNFSKGGNGVTSIADAAIVFSVSAAF